MVRQIRVGKRFVDLRTSLKTQIQPYHSHLSDERLTDEIADFLEREKLVPYMVNRAKRRGGRLF